MALKLYTSAAKGLQLEIRNFVEVTEEKTGRRERLFALKIHREISKQNTFYANVYFLLKICLIYWNLKAKVTWTFTKKDLTPWRFLENQILLIHLRLLENTVLNNFRNMYFKATLIYALHPNFFFKFLSIFKVITLHHCLCFLFNLKAMQMYRDTAKR